jgi:hypothetical protein
VIGLTEQDTKHWAPIPDVIDWLCKRIPDGAKVLEIGPGHVPFPRATEFVDWDAKRALPGPVHKVDLGADPLPFSDKSFDFIYCRHVLEDMFNPFPLCKEMSRVGKAGYVETPSPIAEMGRGVDGGSPPYRGYHHHRWIVWTDGNVLHFVSKYPMVEYLNLPDKQIVEILRDSPRAWNTFCMWHEEIRVRHLQNPVDYYMPTDYANVIVRAMEGAAYENLRAA